jgi:thioredoxin-related protein
MMTMFTKMSLIVVATVAIVATSLAIAQQCSTKQAQCSKTKQVQGTCVKNYCKYKGKASLLKLKSIKANLTGQNFCLGCALKKKLGAGAQCSTFGHKHSLRVTKATANGKELPGMQGWVLYYLETQKSQDLIHKQHGENLSVTGTVYPVERVLEVTSFKKVAAPKEKANETTWHTSLQTALTEAQQRKTLILVDAYAEWCGWCKKLEKDTLSNPQVQARMQEFTLLKIDTDKQPQLAQKYGVEGLPTTLILNPKGEVVLSKPGYMPTDPYLKLLAKALEQ